MKIFLTLYRKTLEYYCIISKDTIKTHCKNNGLILDVEVPNKKFPFEFIFMIILHFFEKSLKNIKEIKTELFKTTEIFHKCLNIFKDSIPN